MASDQNRVHGIVIITGSLLSGAMMALPLFAVPVYLVTTSSAAQLYNQWAQTYDYGHQILPAMAGITFLLYQYAAFTRSKKIHSWVMTTMAGIVTIVMVPFTWVFMVPTNNTLFGLEAQTRGGNNKGFAFEDARVLVIYWSRLHLTRSFFPLIGAAIGLKALLGQQKRSGIKSA